MGAPGEDSSPSTGKTEASPEWLKPQVGVGMKGDEATEKG